MTVRRRDVLAGLGIASALWACGAPARAVRRAPQVSGEVRTWLREAVARLAAVHPVVHALAVSRQVVVAGRDVLGTGVSALRRDGAVLSVRTREGLRREHVTFELTAAGIAAAAAALGAGTARRSLDFGATPAELPEPPRIDERAMHRRVARLLDADARLASRIVYAAAALEHDVTTVWSVAPGHDREQRLVRTRQLVTRAAWSGPRPVVRSLARGWSGALDGAGVADAEIVALGEAVLEQLTPGSFEDGAHAVVLDPSVVAVFVDALARSALTVRTPDTDRLVRAPDSAHEPRNPDVRPPDTELQAPRARIAASSLTVIDDPTAEAAFGGFRFDDAGQPAAPLTLIDAGQLAARLSADASAPAFRSRRAGHLALREPAPAHLVVVPGTAAVTDLYSDGFLLEGGHDAVVDPARDRVRVRCARARELRAGTTTGRVYPDVELTGSLSALLSAIDAIARDPVGFAPHGTDTICTSLSVPALRTRGLVRTSRA